MVERSVRLHSDAKVEEITDQFCSAEEKLRLATTGNGEAKRLAAEEKQRFVQPRCGVATWSKGKGERYG